MARVCVPARLLPRAGARSRRGARLRARAHARDGRAARPAGDRWRQAARGAGEDVADAGRAARARPGARRAHPRRAHGGGLLGSRDRGAGRGRCRRRPGCRRRGIVHGMSATERNGMLKMAELAEASGVSAGTIKHYLREGLLPEPVKTSRNMAWYPPDFVERIQLIKELQERRFMPLKAIKGLLELEGEATRISAAEVKRRFALPQDVLDRLAELEVISPNSRGYGASDVRILEAISRFRAGGYDERIGFTVYDTLRYKRAMEDLVKEEVEVIMERLGGEVDADRAAQLVEKGAEPLRDLISALHTKALVAELKQQRAAGA